MSYSIKPILHHRKTQAGLQPVQILLIFNSIHVYGPTNYKLKKNQLEKGIVKNYPNAASLNYNLKSEISIIETSCNQKYKEQNLKANHNL